jgi:hypothetical protein
MVLLLRLIPNKRCTGCSAVGYCEEKTLLCLYCYGLKINVERRKQKLVSSIVWLRFASLRQKIRTQMEEFGGTVR